MFKVLIVKVTDEVASLVEVTAQRFACKVTDEVASLVEEIPQICSKSLKSIALICRICTDL